LDRFECGMDASTASAEVGTDAGMLIAYSAGIYGEEMVIVGWFGGFLLWFGHG
jgi:hypothetical protein